MKLNSLKSQPGSSPDKKRVGRGAGSGLGKTCGRGVKGQKSRSGVSINGFEGGQIALYRRLPKRGFVSMTAHKKAALNLAILQSAIDGGLIENNAKIDLALLIAAGLVKSNVQSVKIISGNGFSSKVNIAGILVSPSAKEAILSLGGSVAE